MQMRKRPRTPEETYGPALAKAQSAFGDLDPRVAAMRCAVSYQVESPSSGRFRIPFFGQVYQICWPDGLVQEVPDLQETSIATRILLLHHLLTADGTPVTAQWIAFRNLPGGLGYEAAFRQRCSL